MTYYHLAAAFVDQAVYDAAKAISKQNRAYRFGPVYQALELLETGQAGDSSIFDALASDTGLEPLQLYSILHRRAKNLASRWESKPPRYSNNGARRGRICTPETRAKLSLARQRTEARKKGLSV
jgi:hypothetical protein